MPGNIEEKEKCLEKLNQMQKYLPFLDYMIDKIKKKNSEISLECQLSKFQLLRSMIAEKNGKSTWDVIVKAEDVIQKLITKLDFKNPNEKSKQFEAKTSMATSVSIVPPATTAVSATTTSSRTTTIDSKPQDTSTNTVNLIMKTLKISVDTKNTKDKELLSNPLGSVRPVDISGKSLETDLDKDLDGFDLTDCPGLSGTESRNAETVHVAPEKLSTHDDLLSSSREKLLKSLQSRLFPGGIPTSSVSSHVSRNEKANEPQSSAFSRSQINASERKNKSDVSENSENSAVDKNNKKETPVKATEKKSLVVSKSLKSGSSSDRSRIDSASPSSDVNLKQKLKEKLSTDICEVYRVPGKSVGGSLRSLKESKDHKKSSSVEEETLFKPDIPHRSKSTEKKDNLGDKSHRDSTQSDRKGKKSDHSSQKDESSSSGSKKSDDKNSKTSHKDVKKSDRKSSKGEKKFFELSKVNDEELLGFVKDNIHSFPHLSKMKLPELKQAVQSSVACKLAGLNEDEISEISDDSLQDLDEALAIGNKNSKPDDKEKSESKEVSNPDTKLGDVEDISGDESLNDEDYALKLIEDTTPKIQPPKKKKGLLELPMPVSSDLFKDISSIESFESFRSPTESKDPRLRKILEVKKSSDNKTESHVELSKTKEISTNSRTNPLIPKVTSHSSKPQADKRSQEKQCKKDQFNVELTEPLLRNPSSSFKSSSCNNYPRRHSQPSSEAKSYAEYKRRKLKEQERAQRERSKSSDGVSSSDVSRSQPEKEDSGKNNSQDPRRRDTLPKQTNPIKCNNPIRTYENKKSKPRQDIRERKNSQEETKKEEDDKGKKSGELEELVSPLEELYRSENKPKTGRGYGIQNFKIPKKVVQSSHSKKNSDSTKKDPKASDNTSNEVKEVEKEKEKEKGKEKEKEEVSQVPVVESTKLEKEKERKREKDKEKESEREREKEKDKEKEKEKEKEELSQVPVVESTKVEKEKEKEKEKEELSQMLVVESTKVEESKKSDIIHVDSTVSCKNDEKVESSESCLKTEQILIEIESDSSVVDSSENSLNTKATIETNPEPESVTILAQTNTKSEVDLDKTDVQQIPKSVGITEEKVVTSVEPKPVEETVKKVEPQIVECDSSVETSSLSEPTPGKHSTPLPEKSTIVSKEEITQEFVEALIRKSFQSGEGKLLLAQVKLFEKFARKLNSKKLKTIQKIINSESDSSSSSSESSSEDEKKKKKGKKSEERSRSKKKKKKGKNKRKKKSSSSSSSSSSESEESGEEENYDKKEEKNESKKSNSSMSPVTVESEEAKALETSNTSEESKPKSNESSGVPKTKYKKRRRNLEFLRNFGGKNAKRKQKQKKMLEKILNEGPQPEASNDSPTENTSEAPAKEPEPKAKQKKAKGKTELDRLHDDIRSMFISEGVVTATGQRMCRILKQSGGNMNNLDIVKESAKMVEEEKLKKVQTRAPSRNPRGASRGSGENRSRSHSSDKAKGQQESEEADQKLTSEPRVVLQSVDLDNFGYGVKISEDCISFRRMKGGNTAIRRTATSGGERTTKNRSESSLAKNVFLSRNKRKFEQLRDSTRKKSYRGKRLSEVVKNLPLKMAKMKHLQICEKKGDETNGNKNTDSERSVLFSNSELIKYAFDKKQEMYPCKLCNCITRSITGHYKGSHPESEVLISRLNVHEARRAKLEAKKYENDEKEDEERSLAASMKRKVKALLNQTILYNCRMCHSSRVTELNAFASHLSMHTGEYRYKCPSEGCSIFRYSLEDIKFHILTKHSRYRNELNSKITELYDLTVDDGNIFGFLCSKCNFVQICRSNLENHISTQHKDSANVSIIKINMSGKTMGPVNKRKLQKDSATTIEPNRKISTEVEKTPPANAKENDEQENNKRKRQSEDESETGVEQPEKKKLLLNETPEVVEGGGKPEEKQTEETESAEDNNISEDCGNLSFISGLKGSDIIKSVENPKRKDFQAEGDQKTVEPCRKLKVGPLEAQLFGNSGVLYECYVKGCLFSTRVYDLFQKHIKISHYKTKWNGICEICNSGKETKPREDLNFRLFSALQHLKLHELHIFNKGKTGDELLMELKLLNSFEDVILNDEDSETDKVKEGGEVRNNPGETSFPAKPLLRVRNFLGDRLSTPKADENVVERGKEDSNAVDPSKNTTQMFMIENVRSLTEAPAEETGLKIEQVCSLKEPESAEGTGLKIGQVCSLKDQILKPGTQLGHEKTIIVRSCPTRTIPIRPKPSILPVDVGHIVRPPNVSHPVMLNSISGGSPIRLIPAAANSNFNVEPVMVSNDPSLLGSCVMPVIHPGISSARGLKTILKGPKMKRLTRKVPERKSSVEIDRIKSPSSSSPAIYHLASSSSPDPEETDGKKDATTPPRFQSGTGTGKKCVKDAKIYQEMLTKKKLSHLFKCMGVECSFTCNNEQVFTQHIGLHEAQRRLERSKGNKTFKTMEAFYWQQCAYCCEVLNNTKNALSQHVLEEHGHCMYQCAFCFYRAISHSYVEIHQNLAHSQILKTTPRLIYKCRPLKVPPSQTAVLEKHGKRQSVRPYHCDQCGRNFFITQEFTNHLATEHQSVTAYTCHICKNLCFKVNRLINHYKLHSYSTYQCAYCLHGTETEKEMVFHLSNFHFSQPPVMYVRALADGQSDDKIQLPNKKKKLQNNQLDSLKVIIYESDTLSADCVVEVEPEEEITENASSSSIDLSAIVAELGINTDTESSSTTSSSGVTPLMQELASIGDKTAKNLTVKTLLPNAQFSSENESGIENCSVLISSGLSIPSDQNDERDMSIPLGQLPLEAVNVQHKETTTPTAPPPIVSPPDKNLKLNEILVNHYCKSLSSTEEEKIGQSTVVRSSGVHKLPPVVLSRTSASKSSYPSKCTAVRKKSDEQIQIESAEGDKEQRGNKKTKEKDEGNVEKGKALPRKSSIEKDKESEGEKTTKPLITNVVSLSSNNFDKKEIPEPHIVITKICSLSDTPKETKNESQGVVNNKDSKTNSPALKPPIIRVEDFPIEENTTPKPPVSNENPPVLEKATEDVQKSEEKEEKRPQSPDVIILEDQKAKDIVTVTIDSDEEKDESLKKEEDLENDVKDEKIRKEMEILRKQMVKETDSLLSDETEAEKPRRDLSLDVQSEDKMEEPKEKSLLSPIEEAICSLNKKLQSETEEAQKKEEEEKKEKDACSKKADECENTLSDRPRTRFGRRDRRKEGGEGSEKNEGDETRKDDAEKKKKKFKNELEGKDLFICGNEKCNFAGDDDISLKDHLYVCDLSRESLVLVCPHCSRQIKQFHQYLDHLRYHGVKKFHCGLCSFSSAVEVSTSRHVKQKHKCSVLKILPKESKEGHLVYYPKSYKLDKFDFEVNGYSPGDEGKLPPQSVYHVNVRCAKCPYFTKVRSNMVRHLKIHVKSAETEGVVVVPFTAPTNPVPCLETKERMFDKMTNLAASSQLAQAKEKTAVESLSPEEEAKLPQFVTEQMRYKCCLPDCNYITVDEGMLRHHIKALHDEINHYSCPHCKDTVHADVRHVTLDKIGYHLKHHDTKLYKCAHCIYFHYQKNVVEKHTAEKHPDKRYFVHTVREPKPEVPPEEESSSSSDGGSRVWKCALCDEYKTPSKPTLMDHLLKNHNTKSKYKCQLCSMKGNSYQAFSNHFLSKHPGEKTAYVRVYHSEIVAGLETQSGNSSGADSSNEHFDTTPLWQRGAPRIRHIRGILIEEEEIKTKKTKRISVDESEAETSDVVKVKENAFYCPLCTNKKKPFYTRNEDCFRTHLYQELNYQQFACILCGKMFVDRKDFERHHSRVHPEKPQALKQTKEDHEIKFWVDQVIAKRKKQMEEKKRKLSDSEASESQGPPKKKKEV